MRDAAVGGCSQECGLIGLGPDTLCTISLIQPSRVFAGVYRDHTAIKGPCEDGCGGRIHIVSLAPRFCGKAITPSKELSSAAPIRQGLNREGAEFCFDLADVANVAFAGAICQIGEFWRCLIGVQDRLDGADCLFGLSANGSGVGGDKFRIAWLAWQAGAALPRIVVCDLGAISQPLGDLVDAFNFDAHGPPSIGQIEMPRQLALHQRK
jgi:hypothetical protein